MKIIDFTDVNLYPNRYWVNYKNGQRVFTIKSINIENIPSQVEVLGSKKTQLVTGDAIRVKTTFGHRVQDDPEEWEDILLEGLFKVLDFIPHIATGELELKVKQI